MCNIFKNATLSCWYPSCKIGYASERQSKKNLTWCDIALLQNPLSYTRMFLFKGGHKRFCRIAHLGRSWGTTSTRQCLLSLENYSSSSPFYNIHSNTFYWPSVYCTRVNSSWSVWQHVTFGKIAKLGKWHYLLYHYNRVVRHTSICKDTTNSIICLTLANLPNVASCSN